MVKMENLVHLGQMDRQETGDLLDCLVQTDLLEQEVCRDHREKEEIVVNLEKKAHQVDLDCKVHLVHSDKEEKEVKMEFLGKLAHLAWVEDKGIRDLLEMLDLRDWQVLLENRDLQER